MITGREVGRRVDNEEGEVREWHHRGRSYEERSKRQGRTKKIRKGESKGEWSMGLKSGVFIHLSYYAKNKETIHKSGKQDLCRVIKRCVFWLCVYILHLWLSRLKDMTQTNNMSTFFFLQNCNEWICKNTC